MKKPVSLRIQSDLMDRIKKEADLQYRSVNQQFEFILNSFFNEQDKDKEQWQSIENIATFLAIEVEKAKKLLFANKVPRREVLGGSTEFNIKDVDLLDLKIK